MYTLSGVSICPSDIGEPLTYHKSKDFLQSEMRMVVLKEKFSEYISFDLWLPDRSIVRIWSKFSYEVQTYGHFCAIKVFTIVHFLEFFCKLFALKKEAKNLNLKLQIEKKIIWCLWKKFFWCILPLRYTDLILLRSDLGILARSDIISIGSGTGFPCRSNPDHLQPVPQPWIQQCFTYCKILFHLLLTSDRWH